MATADTPADRIPLAEALAMRVVEDDPQELRLEATVHERFDVFGIPHGGYLLAMAAKAALAASGAPDVLSVTVHFLRKAAPGAIGLRVRRLGGSRRFTSWQVTGTQGGSHGRQPDADPVVLTAMVLTGDRSGVDGPAWSDADTWEPDTEPLSPPAGHPDLPMAMPGVAAQFGQRLAVSSTAFAAGGRGEEALVRCVVDASPVDQLAALVACDISPPAVWNVLGMQGWVPTVELTAHVRARPADGPLSVEARTHHVADGFLEEDAVVRDATGRLVVQSRQLARWTSV